MFWSDKKKVSIELNIRPSLSGRDYYTNYDEVIGSVCLKSSSKIYVKTLKVVLYGSCTSSLPYEESSRTLRSSVRHYSLSVEDILVKERIDQDVLPPGDHIFFFKVRIPGDDVQLRCRDYCKFKSRGAAALPPTFKHKGEKANVEITYGIRGFLEKQEDDGSFIATQEIEFRPTEDHTFLSNSHKSLNARNNCIMTYNIGENVKPSSVSLTSLSDVEVSLRASSASSSASSLYSLKLGYVIPVEISVDFKRMSYVNAGILKCNQALSEFVSIRFISLVSPHELFGNQKGEEANKANKFVLSSLVIGLKAITTAMTAKDIRHETKDITLFSAKNMHYDVDLLKFQKGEHGQYELEITPSLYDGEVKVLVPSFQFCNASRDYQLQVSGELRSLASKNSKKFKLSPEVVVLA